MILRRITRHVQEQNWTAIAIELVIVVLGVFLGIELGNWNEARAFRAQEETYLAQLRSEIVHNDQVIEHQSRYVEHVVAGGRRALAFLESAEGCDSGCEMLLIDFFHASQVWGTAYAEAKFREVERLGLPTDEATRLAVQDFFLFIDGWDVVNAAPPIYRERVRGHFTPEASESLWRGCYELRAGHLEELSPDCADALKLLDVTSMLRTLRADQELTAQLRYWIGQNIFALEAYPEMRNRANLAVAAIDRALGRRISGQP